jgi:hypothetical protein
MFNYSPNIPTSRCGCIGSDGISKKLHLSKKDAEHMLRLRYETANVSLSVYPCPVGQGWHLSKSVGRGF